MMVPLLVAALAAVGAVWMLWSPASATRLAALAPPPTSRTRIRTLRTWWNDRRKSAANDELHVLRALVAELRTGLPPDRALCAAQSERVVWPRAARAAQWGSQVAEALTEECPPLAACWRVNARTGAPMAPMVERLIDSRTDDAHTRTALAAALAGPRATARMLALLPVIGIGLGSLLGTQPLAWLLGPGLPAFVAGGVLAAAGAWWTHRITSAVEQQL